MHYLARVGCLLKNFGEHPAHESMLGHLGLNYYWSAFQTEWATDVMFERRKRCTRFILRWCVERYRVSIAGM